MSRVLASILVISLATSAIVAESHARSGSSKYKWDHKSSDAVLWKRSDGGNNHWYQAVLVTDGINWPEAQVRASARGCGWHLATINSKDENDFVFALIATKDEFFATTGYPIHGPWLGGFQRNSTQEAGGQWRWVTDEPFAYTNWGSGEPNNSFSGPSDLAPGVPIGSSENFLHYKRPAGIWNDLPGNALMRGYLLEFEYPHQGFCPGPFSKRP